LLKGKELLKGKCYREKGKIGEGKRIEGKMLKRVDRKSAPNRLQKAKLRKNFIYRP
jgi:hypothetical protein